MKVAAMAAFFAGFVAAGLGIDAPGGPDPLHAVKSQLPGAASFAEFPPAKGKHWVLIGAHKDGPSG